MAILILTIIIMIVLPIKDFVAIMKLMANVNFIAIITFVVVMKRMFIVSLVDFEIQSYHKTFSFCSIYNLLWNTILL